MNTGIKTADPDWFIAFNSEMPTKKRSRATFLVFISILLTLVTAQNLQEKVCSLSNFLTTFLKDVGVIIVNNTTIHTIIHFFLFL